MGNRSKEKTARAHKRRLRVRGRIHVTTGIPRMTVTKSLKNTFVQIVDDVKQVTLVGLGTNSKVMAGKFDAKDKKTDMAKKAGQVIAQLALEKGIKKVVFDRNRYRYHGRVKAVAEGAREKGLEF